MKPAKPLARILLAQMYIRFPTGEFTCFDFNEIFRRTFRGIVSKCYITSRRGKGDLVIYELSKSGKSYITKYCQDELKTEQIWYDSIWPDCMREYEIKKH